MKLFEYGDPVLFDNYVFTYVGSRGDKSVLISRYSEDLVAVETEKLTRIFTKEQALKALAQIYQTDINKITIR